MEISKNRPIRTPSTPGPSVGAPSLSGSNDADLSRTFHLGFIGASVSALLEGRFRLFDNRGESVGLANGDFREHLAIQLDSRASETENEV